MPHKEFDRFNVKMEPLASRHNKKFAEQDFVNPSTSPAALSDSARRIIDETIERIRLARENERPVIVAFGAHAIKNGLAPVFIRLMKEGWVTHLATNGAGVIHDWEFAYQGKSCEHVGPMVDEGKFGHWEDTGFTINLALNIGAYEGKGYGESVGAMIENEGLEIPSMDAFKTMMTDPTHFNPDRFAAAIDVSSIVDKFNLEPGWMSIPHPHKKYSVQAAAYRLGVPSTGHPMFGHDIIYNHPMNHGACLGRTAQRDFLYFAQSVSEIEGGVYISIGSAVMSPMIFEKSLSMAQNVAIQQGTHIDNHFVLVNDLAHCDWDWSQGEPPEENPAYYLRYNKTFSRMGGTMRYLQADNRDFLLALSQQLCGD